MALRGGGDAGRPGPAPPRQGLPPGVQPIIQSTWTGRGRWGGAAGHDPSNPVDLGATGEDPDPAGASPWIGPAALRPSRAVGADGQWRSSAASASGSRSRSLAASPSDRQTTLIVRTDAPVLDPAWTVSQIGLEDLVLAYMGHTGGDRGTGPAGQAGQTGHRPPLEVLQ